jgi:RND family efflux transporter MFP subunit
MKPFSASEIIATAVILGALVLGGCKKQEAAKPPPPPPREIDYVTVAPSEVRHTGEYLGSLLSRGSVTVLPQVNGYVRRVLVKPGQKVAVGTPLIEVDAREESAALASAQAQVAAAQADLGLAIQVRERTEALYREGLATAEELDQRRASTAAAEAATAAAKAQVQQRQVAVQFNSVRAAVAGVVGDVLVRVGDFVTASTRATTISEAGALEVSIAVPASRARGLLVGTPVEILRDDGSVMLSTTVFFISPDADPATQLVEMKASVPAESGLRSSERVRTRVVFSTSTALQVPARAVVRQSGQTFVLVIVDKQGKQVIERRPVKLGDLGADNFLLEKGLTEGERIATSSLQQLRDGAAVKLRAPAPSTAKAPAGAAPAEAAGDAPKAAGDAPKAAPAAGAAGTTAPAPAPSSPPTTGKAPGNAKQRAAVGSTTSPGPAATLGSGGAGQTLAPSSAAGR